MSIIELKNPLTDNFEGTHNFYPPVDNRRVVLVATYTEFDNRIKK